MAAPARAVWLTPLAAVFLIATGARAQDAFYFLPLERVQWTEGTLPRAFQQVDGYFAQAMAPAYPYVVLDGEGEGYVGVPGRPWSVWADAEEVVLRGHLAIRAPAGKEIMGRLFLNKPDGRGMLRLRFRIPSTEARPDAREPFLRARLAYYDHWASQNIPGGAWFRHQVRRTQAALARATTVPEEPRSIGPELTGELQRTYDLFTGGRAMAENLQLDRGLVLLEKDQAPVKVDSIPGITIREIDWQPLIKDAKPRLDPLASIIPADQHAVFLPSFQAVLALAEEVRAHDTPVYRLATPRWENARVAERYQAQLCLPLSRLAKVIGPHVVRSVAATGSDPFFPMGTDVAILFETPQPAVLENLLWMRIGLEAARTPDAKPVQGQVFGVSYRGVRSADRRVCSYLATIGNAVVVTNSPYQLQRLSEVHQGKAGSVASLAEYIFFRQRYPRGDAEETAFVFLSDATIRRWCGPRWRIADSRRVRVAAVLAELQAAHLDNLVRGQVQPGPLDTDLLLPEAGQLRIGPGGVVSSVYGSLEFMTPISEIPLDTVTKAEADAYQRWRDNYQRNWRWAFDPIGLRLSLGRDSLSADMTVMPLIFGTEYRELVAVSQGAALPPGAGDRHAALFHGILALNRQSRWFEDANDWAGTLMAGLSLGWVGRTIEIYADDDPFWREFSKYRLREIGRRLLPEFPEHFAQLPIAVRIESSNNLSLATFLTGVRAVAEHTAPKLTRWERLTYKDQPYVKITADMAEAGLPAAAPNARHELAIYYVATGDALTVTLSERLLKDAVDRHLARRSAAAKKEAPPAAGPSRPWLGSNIAVHVDRKMLEVANALAHDEYQSRMQARAWGNLPILNEWKRRFPDRDPIDVHRQVWYTELLCPGGGRYVWNDTWQTMESTVYGHPGEPKAGPPAPPVLSTFQSASFGLTFENQGLRARAALYRQEPPKAAPSAGTQ